MTPLPTMKMSTFQLVLPMGPGVFLGLQPPNSQDKLNDDIDVDFIKNMIEQGCFDGHMFVGLFNNLWEQIKGVQVIP